MTSSSGRIYTFYSFKGGVGRSMALANVAALLGSWGYKVLVVDWDLEAPGIENYFHDEVPGIRREVQQTHGIVDLATGFADGSAPDWRDCVIRLDLRRAHRDGQPLSLITAGRRDDGFVERLQLLDWEALFREQDFGHRLEEIRKEWLREHDFVLIDSRTGLSDISGICTIFMPDVLVAFFTASWQSLEGVVDVVNRARRARSELPLDRGRLTVVPVPSRDESRTEYKQAMAWRKNYHARVESFFADFLPRGVTAAEALELLRIPNVPYWSFGERLPVVHETLSDPNGISFYYGILARLVSSDLDWAEVLRFGADDQRAGGGLPGDRAVHRRRRREEDTSR